MDRAERRRQSKADEKLLKKGIDPESGNPEPSAAMARQLGELLDTAKRTGVIDPVSAFLLGKVEATVQGLRDVNVACAKGCSHCCHTWVSATGPELLHVAKLLRAKGGAAIARLHAAHDRTRDLAFDAQRPHWTACPMLVDEICTIYAARPAACRMAASMNAQSCAQSYHNLSDEQIPMPLLYLRSRSMYGIALGCALRHAGLPVHGYEFIAGLVRALERPDAERAWLSGEDVFADVKRDPTDLSASPQAQMIYTRAFAGTAA